MDGPSGDWSLRAELVIRPEADGVTVVAAEGGVGPAEVRPLVNTGGCSVTLTAGPRHTLTLTCNPPSRPAPISREVASQTSSSLIPHLLHQFTNNPQVPKEESKTGPGPLRCLGPEANRYKKNPRTVHIDVYCTESSGESGGEGTTLFESGSSKVVHARKSPGETPHGLRRAQRVLSDCTSAASTASARTSSRWSTSTSSTLSSGITGRSVAQTDSFDYENSQDRLRIAAKERQWCQWVSSSSDSDSDSSGPELAWSFAEADGGGLKRTDTIRRSDPVCVPQDDSKQHPLDGLGHSFGPVIRRPNRHIGPTKNPNCPCETCRFYFANAVSPS